LDVSFFSILTGILKFVTVLLLVGLKYDGVPLAVAPVSASSIKSNIEAVT
jgi:hypothetical protein